MHYFAKSLKAGQAGEKAFLELATACGLKLEQTDGRKGDFKDENGDVWEIKSDSYDLQKTTNYFMERISNSNKGTPGGPWQADESNCKYFVYFFIGNNVAYVFDTKSLIEQLKNTPMGQPVYISNPGYQTIGFKVPRSSLTHLYTLSEDGKVEA